jgi:hypothetical protein
MLEIKKGDLINYNNKEIKCVNSELVSKYNRMIVNSDFIKENCKAIYNLKKEYYDKILNIKIINAEI